MRSYQSGSRVLSNANFPAIQQQCMKISYTLFCAINFVHVEPLLMEYFSAWSGALWILLPRALGGLYGLEIVDLAIGIFFADR